MRPQSFWRALLTWRVQGTGDNFYKQGQLLPENFAAAVKESGNDEGLVLRYQDVCPILARSFSAYVRYRDTTIVTISSHPSPRIISTMRLNTYSNSR